MEDIFINILNMSITASYFVIALIILRAIFRKIPRWLFCALWGLVGLRLVLPFSFDSILSLVPSSETIPTGIMYESSPYITSGIGIVDGAAEHILYRVATANPGDSANPLQIVAFIAAAIWLAGIAAMLIYTVVSYLLIKRKTVGSLKAENGTYLCDGIVSPFILGIVKPKIFIPSATPEADISLIVAHEKAHLKRLDHFWKPLGFLILSVYWFNPLMWVAYIFLCRDIEAACDERVLKLCGSDIKKSYSEALINCSADRRIITACPLAFGETDVKSRIKNILSYKKPTLWIILTALIISIVLSVCFMTNPDGMRIDDITGYDGIFSDVEKIQIFIGNGHIYTTEDTRPELSEIKKVRIDKQPVEKSFTPSFRIEIDDEIIINIDESFSYLYLNTFLNEKLRKSYTYSIRNPEVLEKFFSMSNYVTGMEGIYINIGEIEETESGLNFNVTWHNERDIDVEYGELYTLERFTEEGFYEDVPFPENFVFLLPSYLLKSGTTGEKTYFCPMKLPDGEYRFTTTFTTSDGKSYEAKTIFFISNNSEAGSESSETTTLLLSLDDVIRLSEKGTELTWSDFENFSYIETGSGLYIRRYPIDERFSVSVGCASKYSEPIYFYLNAPDKDNESVFIDIRTGDIEGFIENHKNDPIIKSISFSQKGFSVDNTGDNFQTFIDYGCYIPKIANRIQYLPSIKIESHKELDNFIRYFNAVQKVFTSDNGDIAAFIEQCNLYKTEYADFFGENVIFITYAATNNENNFFEIGYATLYNNTLTLTFKERVTSEDAGYAPRGWLIISEINRSELTEFDKVEAYIYPDYNKNEQPLETYTYSESASDIMKPYFILYENGSFSFFFSPLSSYIGTGSYTKTEDNLILNADDGSRYEFTLKNGSYVFNIKNSSENLWLSDIKDGSVFRK